MANRYWNMPSMQLEGGVVRLYAQLTFGALEVDQLTFAALASTGDGDYLVVNDWTGAQWAIALDTTGGAANTPTGAAWTAIPSANKTYLDIHTTTTGSDIATAVATAIAALTGFTAVASAAASTTHVNVTAKTAGVIAAPKVYSKAGAAGTGSITASVTTAGTTAVTLSNAKGFSSVTRDAVGKYTLNLGQVRPTGLNDVDTYVRMLSYHVLWDATGNSGTAPAAPLTYLTANAVATAGSGSFQLETLSNMASVKTPAGGEKLFLEVQLLNNKVY